MSRVAAQSKQIEYPSRRNKKAAKKAAKQAGKLHLVRMPAPEPAFRRRPSAEVAAENIRMLIDDMISGRRAAGDVCTFRDVYAELGLSPTFGCSLMRGHIKRVGTRIIDRVCIKTRMTAADLLDEISDVLDDD